MSGYRPTNDEELQDAWADEQQPTLIDRLSDEADLCRNDGATDIANLLDEARAELSRLQAQGRAWRAANTELEAEIAHLAHLTTRLQAAGGQGVEPAAWMHTAGHMQGRNPMWEPGVAEAYSAAKGWTPLYAHPPAAPALSPEVDADCRQTVIWSLMASKSWTKDYAEAYVDDWLTGRVAAPALVPLTDEQIKNQFNEWADQRGLFDHARPARLEGWRACAARNGLTVGKKGGA